MMDREEIADFARGENPSIVEGSRPTQPRGKERNTDE
jgi:hypothetical protein